MIANINMLAKDNGDFINLLIFAVLVGISVVGGWLQKRAERKAEDNQDSRAAQRRKKDHDLRESIADHKSPRKDVDLAQHRARRRQESASMRRPASTVKPVSIQRQTYASQPSPPELQRKRHPQAPPALDVQASQQILKTESMSHLEHPICEMEPEKPRAHLGELSIQVDQVEISQHGTIRNRVRLSGKALARQAMIYHEIFSSPKALRTERENWDV